MVIFRGGEIPSPVSGINLTDEHPVMGYAKQKFLNYLEVIIMYNEKQKVSKIKNIVMRMKNNCFNSQEELMQSVVRVLCADKTEMKMYSGNWHKDYNYNADDFENDNGLLRELDMSREYNQIMTNEQIKNMKQREEELRNRFSKKEVNQSS